LIQEFGSTVHCLRSSFRDWVAEAAAHPSELAEIAMAYAVGDATERAYVAAING
jgi:hypothetical protein